jgi:hypothetical protein
VKVSKSKAFVVEMGRCPESGDECEFKISTQRILWIHKNGPSDKFYNLRNVPFAINHPDLIFKGLQRDGHESSFCYVSRPVRRFISDIENVPVEEGWVFLVFFNSRLEIFDWRFEKAGQNSRFPENHVERFRELIWPTKP